MDNFANIVYAALPWALGFIALIGLAILVLHLRIKHIESQPKEVKGVGTGTDDDTYNRRIADNINAIRKL